MLLEGWFTQIMKELCFPIKTWTNRTKAVSEKISFCNLAVPTLKYDPSTVSLYVRFHKFFLCMFPGSPPSVFQSEQLPAEVSYISLLGVTSLFWGPRSGELGLWLQMGPMGPLPPTDPLRGGGGGRQGSYWKQMLGLSCWETWAQCW